MATVTRDGMCPYGSSIGIAVDNLRLMDAQSAGGTRNVDENPGHWVMVHAGDRVRVLGPDEQTSGNASWSGDYRGFVLFSPIAIPGLTGQYWLMNIGGAGEGDRPLQTDVGDWRPGDSSSSLGDRGYPDGSESTAPSSRDPYTPPSIDTPIPGWTYDPMWLDKISAGAAPDAPEKKVLKGSSVAILLLVVVLLVKVL